MAYQYFTQLFTGGVNKDMDPAAIDLSSQNNTVTVVADVGNMVFERGLLLTRPGLGPLPSQPFIPGPGNIRSIKWLPFAPRSVKIPITDRGALAITDTPALYSLEANQNLGVVLNPTQITGPGFAQDGAFYCDHSIVNGVVLLGGNQSGLIRWDPATTVYTILANSPYMYVCGHLSRGVAAYDITRGATGFAQTVAWSAAGDETNWTTGPTSDAGLSVLADISDSITGLKVVSGMIVVARTYGFHIGIPTGQYPIVYDWRKISDQSIGVMHPASLCVYKNLCFFMSECGIHTFDLVDTQDIGEGIYVEINNLIRQYNLTARGFISPGYKPDFQPSYNIMLDSQGPQPAFVANDTPHYMYNIKEQKWSRHLYNNAFPNPWTPLAFSAEYIPAGNPDPAAVPFMAVQFRNSATAQAPLQWIPGNQTDNASFFQTGQLTLSDPTQDIQLERVELQYYSSGIPTDITITVQGILNGQSFSQVVTITTYAVVGWDRRWYNLRVTGNMIDIFLNVNSPAGAMKFKAMILEYTTVGKVRT
jgi:hypothetical protein